MTTKRVLSTIISGSVLLLLGAVYAQGETLREAVDKTLKTHPLVKSSTYNTLARTEEVRQAKSGYLPTLNFTAGYGIQEIYEPADESLNSQIYTLSLRQNIFNGFATSNEVDRQKARVRSGAFEVHGTSDLIALRTAEVFLNVLRRQELLQLAEENLQNHQRIADQIQLRSESGVSSTSERDQVQGRLALARANVVVAQTNLLDAQSNYSAIVGNVSGSLEKPDPPINDLPATLEEAEYLAMAGHPTLKSANADLEARHKQHEVAAAPYWPILDLEVDRHWEEDFDRAGIEDNLIVLLRLRFNLFNGLRDDARRAETAYLVSEAKEIENNTARQVIESIRLSWMAYQAALDQRIYLEQRVSATQDTAESYLKQFNFGKRTLLDVLDTEAEVIDAQNALVNSAYNEMYSQYRILNGTGKLVESLGLKLPAEARIVQEEKYSDKT